MSREDFLDGGGEAYNAFLRSQMAHMEVALVGGQVPTRGTPDSVGYDLYLPAATSIGAHSTKLIGLGVIVRPPDGYWILLAQRSSLAKKGLILGNGVGIVDPDYCGPKDEIKVMLTNLTDQTVFIDAGDRVAQMILLPTMTPDITVVESIKVEDRGGFGSTGR